MDRLKLMHLKMLVDFTRICSKLPALKQKVAYPTWLFYQIFLYLSSFLSKNFSFPYMPRCKNQSPVCVLMDFSFALFS